MLFVLAVSAASAQSRVTFEVGDRAETRLILQAEEGAQEPWTCTLPCTLDLPSGVYGLRAERGRTVQYSAALVLYPGESWVTLPVAQGLRMVPNFSEASCFPLFIPLVHPFKDEAPLVQGEAEAL